MGFAGIAAERREKRQRVLNAAQIRRRECVLMQMAQHPQPNPRCRQRLPSRGRAVKAAEAEQRTYPLRHGLPEAEHNADSEYPAISAGNAVQRTKHDEQLLRSVGGARYGSIVASARILTDLAFQRNVQPALDAIQPYVVVLMHLSGVVDRLPVAC